MTGETSGRPYVIGLDIGTSSCKAVAYSLEGARLAAGRATYPTSSDSRGGVHQYPGDWWSSTIAALSQAARADGVCRAVALSAQLGTYVALDEQLEPLEDAWTWQDAGPREVLGELAGTLDLGAVSRELGTWLPLGASWPLPRLLWMARHRPEVLEATKVLAMPKDYVLARLTGELVTDPSSWRGLVTPGGRVLTAALDALGLPDLLAPRLPPTSRVGGLLPAVASAVGLPAGTPVHVGTGDYACALLGSGASRPGDAFDIGGTSEHIGAVTSSPVHDPMLSAVPYLEASEAGSFVCYGVTSNGGSITEWLGDVLLANARPADLGEALSAAASASTNPRPLFFVPYLNGERSPVWDPDASAAWVGLRSDHGQGDLIRAAFEGVAFNLRQIRERSPLLATATPVRSTGGTSRSDVWNQIKADILQTEIAVVAEADASALGAAMLAATGVGEFTRPAEASTAMTRTRHVVAPSPHSGPWRDEQYFRYRSIAAALHETEPSEPKENRR